MVESDRGKERMTRVASFVPIAEKLNVSMSKLAIAWCLLNKNVSTVILGASKMEQLEENLKSAEVLPLLDETIQQELLLI
jgi:aryl-alcohol dehydrogenase-like predicted oxidoreductase